MRGYMMVQLSAFPLDMAINNTLKGDGFSRDYSIILIINRLNFGLIHTKTINNNIYWNLIKY
jgi:hypothetical protein